MDRTEGAGNVDGLFVAEDPAINRPPTEITAEWLNGVQEELIAAIEGGGLTPTAGDTTQLHQAIQAMVVAHAGGDDPHPVYVTDADLAAAIAACLLPAGSVIYVAKSAAPTGYLKANGAAVSRTTYAALFAAIGTAFGVGDGSTTFNLPDLRGEFMRGWDDGRGVDSGRTLGSAQAATSIRAIAMHGAGDESTASGAHIGTPFAGADSSSTATPSGAMAPYNGGSSLPSAASDNYIAGTPYPSNGGTAAFNTWFSVRARNVALLACIKF